MKTQSKFQTLLILGLALVLCAALVRPTWAAPQATLQELINDAADGATINIPAGGYTENLTVTNKSITLRGADPTTTVIQAADSSQRVITATSDKGLRLENLALQGGHPTSATGGGVYAPGGTLTIVNCRITNNSALYGGGIFLGDAGSSLVLSGSTIDHNTATYNGGGIFAAGSVTLNNTDLTANSASNHGGGLHAQSGPVDLTGGTVSNNHALNGNGGGINVNDGITVSGATFSGNTAAGLSDITGSGGAITQWNSGNTVSITETIFSANTAQVKGGAVFINESFLTLYDSSFTNNVVDSGGTGTTRGGGVYAGGGLDGSSLSFVSNKAKCTGCPSTAGGGLEIQRPATGPSAVTASTFDGNLAWFGSGISSGSKVQLTLTGVSFTNNGGLTADAMGGYGGGVNAYWVHGDRLLFQNNKVINFGGGVCGSHIALTHSRFIGNTATAAGGGVYVYEDLTGSNLLLVENTSSSGAAINVKSNKTLTLYNVTIARPTQAAGPAVYLEDGVTFNLYNSIVNNYTFAVTFAAAGTLNEDYNLFYNNGSDIVGTITINSGGHSTGLIPPGFANPAAGNYHLKSSSYAIGHGHNYGLADDLDGRLRLSGRNDIGAYQFWTGTYIPLIRR